MKATKTPARNLTPEQKRVSKMVLYGGLMAGLLYSIKTDRSLPDHIRAKAEELQVKWETVSPWIPTNPITIIEMEKQLQ